MRSDKDFGEDLGKLLSDGNKILKPQKIRLKPYFEK